MFHNIVKAFTTNRSVQPKKRKCRTTVPGESNEITVVAAVAQNVCTKHE